MARALFALQGKHRRSILSDDQVGQFNRVSLSVRHITTGSMPAAMTRSTHSAGGKSLVARRASITDFGMGRLPTSGA